MNREDPFEIARRMAKLNVWDSMKPCQWAVIPRLADEAAICLALKAQEEAASRDPVTGRLLVFSGYGKFHIFAMREQNHDFGVAMRIAELDHIVVETHRSGAVEIVRMKPGYIPRGKFNAKETAFLSSVLYECYGIMLRCEENPGLLTRHIEDKALFARWQNADGSWRDGTYKIPVNAVSHYTEQIALLKTDVAKAKTLDIVKGAVWICDFSMIENMHTREEWPRFAYLFSGMDFRTGELVFFHRMSVDETHDPIGVSDPADALKVLWERLASRLLREFLRVAFVPGEIVVPTARHFRFLRPLTLQLPVRLSVKNNPSVFATAREKALAAIRGDLPGEPLP